MTAETAAARQLLTQARTRTAPALREAIDELPGHLRHLAGYHLGWWDEHGRARDGDGGKALRPALALACARAVGSTATATAVPAAVAVELVHNFSLVHDDVMDGDATRRHRPTVWKVFGVGQAILLGDALLSLAYSVLGRLPRLYPDAVRMLTAATTDLIEGQSDDLAFCDRLEVTPAECLAMARKKTGALMACSAGLGALGGGGAPAQVTQLCEFGADLGLAFQCADDLLGIWGDPATTGKPAYSDLVSRKKSLPVTAAFASRTAAGDWLLAAYHRDDLNLHDAAAAVELAGGRAWCQRQADELIERARASLTTGVPLAHTRELSALAALFGRRDR
ncbi:MAG TPA: polyprenyl synthetase family protein [Candidatus Limnocylindrales bacterium]|nr:polyprenyl synthetase family protein [Candidatus Limnocylindrales bacterium]